MVQYLYMNFLAVFQKSTLVASGFPISRSRRADVLVPARVLRLVPRPQNSDSRPSAVGALFQRRKLYYKILKKLSCIFFRAGGYE